VILHRLMFGEKVLTVWDEFEAAPAKAPWRLPRLKLSPIEIIVVTMIVGVLVGLALPSGDSDYTHRFPPPGPNPGNGFANVAGEYFQGIRGRHWRLSILPDGRYSFIWSGCCGVYHRESGSVNRVSGHLVLSPLKPIKPRLERVFLPLKWGRRTYLIPPERLEDFCDAIIQGSEPSNDSAERFYVLGLELPVTGTPELPEQWATYLRKNLVIGTIVEVKEDGRAKIDAGSTEGIRVGTILTVQGRDVRGSRQLTIISVSRNSCVVEEVYPGESKKPLEEGWKVVTARETEASPSP
jgi:hypothetical protein